MPAPNTSATGGYLKPVIGSPAPLEGKDLLVFLQSMVVGITGLPGEMVRPRWQPEAPNMPQTGTAWAAIGVNGKPSDTFAAVLHDPTGDGTDKLIRTQILEVLCSFYDTGSTGLADYYAAMLRDGLSIAQNREPLALHDMGLVDVGVPQPVPVVVKRRWLYRVDLPVNIRRRITRVYPVENLLEAPISIDAEVITQNRVAGPDPPP